MNIIASLQAMLKAKRKTLTEFQTFHLQATIAYLQGMKTDYASARKDYEKLMKENER